MVKAFMKRKVRLETNSHAQIGKVKQRNSSCRQGVFNLKTASEKIKLTSKALEAFLESLESNYICSLLGDPLLSLKILA